jgi:hypothetical protein
MHCGRGGTTQGSKAGILVAVGSGGIACVSVIVEDVGSVGFGMHGSDTVTVTVTTSVITDS